LAEVVWSSKLINELYSIREINMLRIKHKSFSMQFSMLLILCFCCGLTMSHWLMVASAAERREQSYYIVDAYQTPGVVYRIVNRKPNVLFERRSGNITSIAIYKNQLFFCSVNDRRIYQSFEKGERVVFEYKTYIRDIAVDSNGNLYFSDASGSKDDGKIHRLSPPIDELDPKGRFSIPEKEEPINVSLKSVDGFWAGDFTFDSQGNLYLSTGNRTPAFIYRVQREKDGTYGPPKNIYRDSRSAIKGIALEPNTREPNNPIFIYYADWEQCIQMLNIRDLGRNIAFSFSKEKSQRDNRHLSDVAFDVRIRR